MTEDKPIVRGRLAQDSCVVDDAVGGYMDNDMDDLDENKQYADSEREEKKSRTYPGVRM